MERPCTCRIGNERRWGTGASSQGADGSWGSGAAADSGSTSADSGSAPADSGSTSASCGLSAGSSGDCEHPAATKHTAHARSRKRIVDQRSSEKGRPASETRACPREKPSPRAKPPVRRQALDRLVHHSHSTAFASRSSQDDQRSRSGSLECWIFGVTPGSYSADVAVSRPATHCSYERKRGRGVFDVRIRGGCDLPAKGRPFRSASRSEDPCLTSMVAGNGACPRTRNTRSGTAARASGRGRRGTSIVVASTSRCRRFATSRVTERSSVFVRPVTTTNS